MIRRIFQFAFLALLAAWLGVLMPAHRLAHAHTPSPASHPSEHHAEQPGETTPEPHPASERDCPICHLLLTVILAVLPALALFALMPASLRSHRKPRHVPASRILACILSRAPPVSNCSFP
ncbi:MAG: hypothetical protein IT440_00705 [Phycisphaeraceae bacterium]|nr:hypothetical protein [Phycisphaeraceae bacterium]